MENSKNGYLCDWLLPWQQSAIHWYEQKGNPRCVANLHCECQGLKPKGETNSSYLVLHRSSGEDTVNPLGSHLNFVFFSFVHTQTTDIDWLESLLPLAIVVFLVFIFDFYIESFCLAKLESPRTGKIGSIASFLSAMVIALLWDQPWAWSMHEWHHGKPSDPHLVSAGTFFSAFFFVLGRFFFFSLITKETLHKLSVKVKK